MAGAPAAEVPAAEAAGVPAEAAGVPAAEAAGAEPQHLRAEEAEAEAEAEAPFHHPKATQWHQYPLPWPEYQ